MKGTMALATETRTDTQIQTDVLAKLKSEPRVLSNEIGVIEPDVLLITVCVMTVAGQ